MTVSTPVALRIVPSSPSRPLRLDRTTRFTSPRELTLRGVSGWAWVTVDDDPRDIVLGSGQHHTVPAHRRVTVSALYREGHFEVTVARVAASPRAWAALAASARHAWHRWVAGAAAMLADHRRSA